MKKKNDMTNSDTKYIPATAEEWDRFFKKNGPRIVRSLGRCGSPQDCEDAVQAAAATIMGLDPDHHLEAPLEPRTEEQWVGFVRMHARAHLSHMYEHDAKWTWAGNTHKELRDAEADALADAYTTAGPGLRVERRALTYAARIERLRCAEPFRGALILPENAPPVGSVLAARVLPDLAEWRSENISVSFDRNGGVCRVILTGAQEQVAKIMQAYEAQKSEH